MDIEYTLSFEILCNHQIRKVYRIRLFEANPSSVSSNASTAVNTISIRPALLQKGIQYLQTRDEILMKVLNNAVSVETIPQEGEVRTVSNLNTGDMDEFTIQAPTSLRFFITVVPFILINHRGSFRSAGHRHLPHPVSVRRGWFHPARPTEARLRARRRRFLLLADDIHGGQHVGVCSGLHV